MPARDADLFAITANHLRTGHVVFMDGGGGWTECMADARVIDAKVDGAGELETALAEAGRAEAAGVVVGVYEIAVEDAGEGIRPLRLRERIRAFGPSTHADFRRADVAGHLDHADGVVAVRFGI